MPDLERGSLHSVSAALATIFMTRAMIITEKMHPVIIIFSSQYQSDAVFPEVTLSLKLF